MDQQTVENALAGLPITAVSYHDQVGSTNDLAAEWAARGAPDLALVIADAQTAGRGRAGRRWHTPPGAALAFSLVLHPPSGQVSRAWPHFSALGAIAVCEGLVTCFGLSAQIKWPNDVLLAGQKLAGVLTEAHWTGDHLSALILGIGINMSPAAVPAQEDLDFPATCIQAHVRGPLDRLAFLRAVLGALIQWRARVHSPLFIPAWEARLAFRGLPVSVRYAGGRELQGVLVGLTHQGQLSLETPTGTETIPASGDVRLRPVDTPQE